MRKENKLIALGAAALAVLLIVFAAVWSATRPAASQGGKSVTVEVIHRDGERKTFTYQTDAEYLAGLLVDEGLAQGEEGQYGLMIDTVDGEKAVYEEDQSYWAIYQNGEYAQLGAGSLPIHDGDAISLVYTVYSDD